MIFLLQWVLTYLQQSLQNCEKRIYGNNSENGIKIEKKREKLKITQNSFLCNDLQFYCQCYINSFQQKGQGQLLSITFVSDMLK